MWRAAGGTDCTLVYSAHTGYRAAALRDGLRLKPHGRNETINGLRRPFMARRLPWSLRARPSQRTAHPWT